MSTEYIFTTVKWWRHERPLGLSKEVWIHSYALQWTRFVRMDHPSFKNLQIETREGSNVKATVQTYKRWKIVRTRLRWKSFIFMFESDFPEMTLSQVFDKCDLRPKARGLSKTSACLFFSWAVILKMRWVTSIIFNFYFDGSGGRESLTMITGRLWV